MAQAKLLADFLYIPTPPFMKLDLECQFNPQQLTMTKRTKWHGDPVPSRDHPRTEYKGGEATTYSLDLYFDAWASGGTETKDDPKGTKDSNGNIKQVVVLKRRDVRKDINTLMAMSLRTGGYMIGELAFPYLMEPPSIMFVWGDVQLFRAYLSSITVTYTQFDSEGAPVRAKASCTFVEQSHPLDFMPPQNPSSRTNPRQTVRVTQGDRLDNIASNYYGDPRMWRSIAQENDLDDPFSLKPGQLLSMPPVQ